MFASCIIFLSMVYFFELQAYHHELLEAYECCMKYRRTGKDAELTQVPTDLCLNFSKSCSSSKYFILVSP